MGWIFLFFIVSGFCSILYEVIWLRLSMAQFGVTNAMVSIILSMFMAGLGLGSWISGRAARKYGQRVSRPAMRVYAFLELAIGVSAIVVPYHEGCWIGSRSRPPPPTTWCRGFGWRLRSFRGVHAWEQLFHSGCWPSRTTFPMRHSALSASCISRM